MGRKWTEENAVMFIDFDPNATDSTAVSSTAWLDMSRYNRFTAIAFRTIGTGNVSNASIRASNVVAGTSATSIVSLGSTVATGCLVGADPGSSVGSNDCGIIVLDVTADEIAANDEDARYVSMFITPDTATDEWGVIYILSEPRYAAANLTSTGSAAS